MLDHTGYPALVNQVIGYAAAHAAAPGTAHPRTLAALRLTSRAVRDTVDAALLHHAELAVTTHGVALIAPRDARFPIFGADSPPPRARMDMPLRPHLVRILDLDLDDDGAGAPPALAGLSVSTLRRFADGRRNDRMLGRSLPLSAHTLVDFLRPRDGVVAFPAGVRRYVLHLGWAPAIGSSGQYAHLVFGAQSLREVALVLRPRVMTWPEDEYRGLPTFVADALRLGFEVVRRGGSLTVAGGELVHPLQLGGREGDPRWKLELFESVLWGLWRDAGYDDDSRERVRAVRLVDWWRGLGEQREVEGVWPAGEDA
ncbi:uncharacterized protein LOC62_05G007583 [Vanrija pseudolonga]|uniref:Uncharacterized protein n=1 Tax=Vanrija pseudolonga TaxID=143232 RepID=A0AAF1BN57_9TREE|nr:hypothetical protein LOC62_05G007583 [Vanrija pseudolonga]